MDMINTWLNDFAQWGKIFTGFVKAFENIDVFSSKVLPFLKPESEGGIDSQFSTAWEGLGKAFEGSAPKKDA